jgi:hypothetical protein
VAGRIVLEAPDLTQARELAETALVDRRRRSEADGERSVWSLGVLRPLTARAPGTRKYRVVFSRWEAVDDHFERRDVHEMELWAVDAASARRQAQQDIQGLGDYVPAWRIRVVERA